MMLTALQNKRKDRSRPTVLKLRVVLFQKDAPPEMLNVFWPGYGGGCVAGPRQVRAPTAAAGGGGERERE